MKILVISPISYAILFEMKQCLEEMGYDVQFIGTTFFSEGYNWIGKELYHFGWKALKSKYYEHLNKKILQKYADFNPDFVLVTNGTRMMPQTIKAMKRNSKVVLWLFDSIRRDFMASVQKLVVQYDAIYVFEQKDIGYIKKQFHINALYCPVGYNAYRYYPQGTDRKIDLIFVGNYLKCRLDILRDVAHYAKCHNLDFRIYGNWYHKKPIWKRLRFKRQEPVLYSYIINHTIHPSEVAKLYGQSKICLNIHEPLHKGLNPRTFDILATRSFQLIDVRQDYGGLVAPQVDFVTYSNIQDLLEKIDYYLQHKDERQKIAHAGYEHIKSAMPMKACLKRILENNVNEIS